MKTPIKPQNAPENIEWNAHFNMWMAIMDTNAQGEVTLHYWDKRGYLYSEVVYDSNNVMIRNRQFTPEGVPKNAVYVPMFDTWVTPQNPLSEEKQRQLIEAFNKFEEEQIEKVKEEVIQEVKQELDQELESLKRMTDENSELNTMFSALKQIGEVAKEVNEEAKIPKSDFEQFRTTLIYGFDDIFCNFAGGKKIYVNDNELVYKRKNWIHPESGDWVFYDKRCQAGTFGVSHEDFSISKVTLKKPEEHEVDYSLPKIKRVVSTQKLNERYIWLAFFFCSWEHRVQDAPFNKNWGSNIATFDQNLAALNKTFNKEIKHFKDDPYLAMYWLLHTGICCDDRYEQVKQQVVELGLHQKAINGDEYMLEEIQQCLVFFEQLDDYQNLSLDTRYRQLENKELFLIRRAYVVYITQSCASDNKNHFEKWWQSVFLYPKLSKTLIFRMYWLRKNLVIHNQWDKFDAKIQSEKIDIENPSIPLLSYVLASHPNIENTSRYADLFLSELKTQKWSDKSVKNFAGTMLWNLKELFTDTATLKEVMDFYFFRRFDNEEYQDIVEYHFGKDTNTEEALEHQQQLDKLLENFDSYWDVNQKTFDSNQKILENCHQYLQQLDESIIRGLVKVANSKNTAYVLIEYLFLSKLEDKQELLLRLLNQRWKNIASDDMHLFTFLKSLIANEDDENIDVILFLAENLTEETSWTTAIAYAFADNLHNETIFNKVLNFIDLDVWNNNKVFTEFIKKTCQSVRFYTHFRNENDEKKTISYYAPANCTKAQMEALLNLVLLKIKHFIEDKKARRAQKMSFDAIRVISNSGENPLARSWLEEKLKPQNWQEIVDIIDNENAADELKSNFESGLDW